MVRRGGTRSAFGKQLIKLGGNLEKVSRARIEINAMIILRAMLNFAWREGLISGYERPWARVAAYKISKPKDTQGFSRAECEGLIKHCPGDLRSLVLGALFTGARICELRALKRSAFDFASGLLLIYSPKVRRTRRIILSFEAIDFFEHIGLPLGPEDLLFQKTSGEPWVGSDHGFFSVF